MRKGVKLVVKATSLRGNQSIDTYTPDGFAQAMDRLQKECPGRDAVLEARGLGFESDQRPSCGGPAHWNFLDRACFALKTPDLGGWISLDFLGFSRPNRDLSVGYTGFSLKSFSWPFCSWAFEAAERKAVGEAMRKRRRVHRASLTRFLIFCNLFRPDAYPEAISTPSRSVYEPQSATIRDLRVSFDCQAEDPFHGHCTAPNVRPRTNVR
jgi:hypothetical protein